MVGLGLLNLAFLDHPMVILEITSDRVLQLAIPLRQQSNYVVITRGSVSVTFQFIKPDLVSRDEISGRIISGKRCDGRVPVLPRIRWQPVVNVGCCDRGVAEGHTQLM
jgi:hypothetical protein